jgi:hypothetical protein
MTRKVGQIVQGGSRIWLVRVYNGTAIPKTKKRKYLNQTVYGGLRTLRRIWVKCSVGESAAEMSIRGGKH